LTYNTARYFNDSCTDYTTVKYCILCTVYIARVPLGYNNTAKLNMDLRKV